MQNKQALLDNLNNLIDELIIANRTDTPEYKNLTTIHAKLIQSFKITICQPFN